MDGRDRLPYIRRNDNIAGGRDMSRYTDVHVYIEEEQTQSRQIIAVLLHIPWYVGRIGTKALIWILKFYFQTHVLSVTFLAVNTCLRTKTTSARSLGRVRVRERDTEPNIGDDASPSNSNLEADAAPACNMCWATIHELKCKSHPNLSLARIRLNYQLKLASAVT